jgi:Soluble lytic murein transglycosylase and related regulatory proteins (some contain LysM/invasin domains)
MGVGLQEAGIDQGGGVTVWPWSVNAEGEGRFLKDADQAISWVRDRQARGDTLIDVGCMQINLRWHPDAFASLEDAFDPDRNVDYAARYLVSLYERVGDWPAAVGRYHSADPGRAGRYLAGVETNLRVLEGGVATAPAGATPFEGDLDRYLDALVSDTPDQTNRPLWSAGLGAERSGEEPVYGLYGPAGLRPVLPNFMKSF